ncbi:hypothetical protein Ocin01_19870 [Orchesella cincta]|uniref:Uncharacterized protein n=1 Tax=Orchesella cincta TaxID=48709 RepID=A0A1D2M1I1_ORCCI|nr:hypothetical protein Ocin01_19870 [Orchesella cincta]
MHTAFSFIATFSCTLTSQKVAPLCVSKKALFLTACHVTFIAHLLSRKVISDFDAECLKTIDNRFEKAAKFYEIIVNRKDSYNVVREALEETCQTGALAILNKLGNSPGASQNALQQKWNA